MNLVWCAVSLMSVASINCANILVFNSAPLFSHQIALREVWLELSRRGHNVTLVCSHPTRPKDLDNFKEIEVSALGDIFAGKTMKRIESTTVWDVWSEFLENISIYLSRTTLSDPRVQDWIVNHEKYKFDVVIVESWFPELFAFARIYNCPSIGFVTIWDTHLSTHYHLGNPVISASSPDINLPYAYDLDFEARIWSALFIVWEMLNEFFVYMPLQQRNLDEFFPNFAGMKVGELKQDIDLQIINANPLLTTVKAVGPTTVFVGDGNHIQPKKPLPQHLKTYLDAAKEGFIYVSFGSNVKSKDLEDHVLDVLLEVMGKMPFKILWKYEAEDLPKKPKNVKIVEWAPQQDILRHKNIKLFISQGGVQSMEEAIFSHVPILVMPFFGDQFKNGKLATSKGFGKTILHRPRLDKFELESAILELTDNPKYKNTAARLAKLMNDSYMTGVEKSVWWIEYVIRNNGTKELRNPAAKLPFYQLYALDVIGFLLAVTIALVTAAVLVCRKISNLLLAVFGSQKALKQKKL